MEAGRNLLGDLDDCDRGPSLFAVGEALTSIECRVRGIDLECAICRPLTLGGSLKCMRGYVGRREIILWFTSDENLTPEGWEELLDELKSHTIPGLYQAGMRSHATIESATRTIRIVIYLTDRTVTPREAGIVLRRWNIDLVDEYGIAI